MSEEKYQYNTDALDSVAFFSTSKQEATQFSEDLKRLEISADNVFVGRVEQAIEWVKENAIPSAILVDIDEDAYPLESLAALCRVCGPRCHIVAVGSTVNLDLYRNMLAQGLFDYLLKPVTLDRLSATFTHMKKGKIEEQLIGRTVAVTGVKGGIGTSTIAFGIAQILAKQSRITTALVDYDRTNGCQGLLAGTKEDGGLDGVLKSDSIDVRFLSRSMTTLSDKFSLLHHSPNYQSVAAHLPDEQLLMLGATLCQMFNQVVWDIPAGQPEGATDVLACAQTRVIVVNYTVAAARNVLRLIQEIGDESEGQRIVIVANHQNNSRVINRDEFERFIGRKIDAELSDAGKVLEQQLIKGGLNLLDAGSLLHELTSIVDIICGRPATKKNKRPLFSRLSSAFERKAS